MKKYFIIFNLLLSITMLYGQAPQLVNYQGKLDSAGVPLNGTRNLTFSIYNVATAGTALWTETQTGVAITNGIFNVLLGSVTTFPATLFTTTGERYLGFTVGTGTEMVPRYRITSTAFSIRAANADDVADNAVTSAKILDGAVAAADLAGNSVTTVKIADNAVTSAKILDGAIATVDLADNSITSAKIVDGTIAAADLASNSVTTAKITDNNVTAAKIADEPGVVHYASLPFWSQRPIPSGVNSLDSVSITIPASGYVQVFAAFTACISHTNLTTDELYFQVMNSRNSISFSNTGYGMIRLPGELPTNTNYWYPFHLSRIFTETSSGTYKYYINARVFSGWDTNDRFYNLQLSAVYYPTAYGTVVSTKQDINTPGPFESATDIK